MGMGGIPSSPNLLCQTLPFTLPLFVLVNKSTVQVLPSQLNMTTDIANCRARVLSTGVRVLMVEKKYEDLERQVASLKVHVSKLELQL